MVKKEIPVNDWEDFLESFTMRHDGWLVDVESIRDGKATSEAENEPLEGLVARTDQESPGTIVVTVGGSTESHRRIVVEEPRSVSIEADNGVESAIEIETGDGSLTRVGFVSPMPPEAVDGIII